LAAERLSVEAMRTVGRRHGRRLLMIAAAGAACSLLAACGGTQVTKSDVVARGNAICAGALRDMRAVPAPAGTSGSLAALSAYERQVAPIVEREAKAIQALPKPSEERALLERYMAAVARDAAQYRVLAGAAQAGDAAGVAQALATLRQSGAASLAGQYGLTQCAAPGSTAVS
jgi:hypothetical protein